ncbi:MAG TPA: hotdog fold domain-containing protein [Steroidobacteraceae bacterium]|nr:hotdog fold domain-containing protein [Steroidobacteraceae bacterium]
MTSEIILQSAVPAHNLTLLSWQKRSRSQFGRWWFARSICRRSPYFASLRPAFVELRPALCVVLMPRRHQVTGRGGGVHPLAIANLCELAASTVAEVTVPWGMRWSSRGMTIEYLRRAESEITATARLDKNEWEGMQNVAVPVSAVDRNGTEVVRAVITLRVEPGR